MTLLLPHGARATMLDHAREGLPREVCGVLAGHRDDEGSDGDPDDRGGARRDRAERAIRARNAADDPRRAYEIPPVELHGVLTDVEDAGLDVIGFYHSHPTGAAAPSPTDRAAATWDDHLYVVVAPAEGDGGAGGTVRAWRWSGDSFAEEPVDRP